MRKTLGAGVLIAGVAGIGFWGAYDQAETMEDKITNAATAVAEGAIHRVNTRVAGRDITVRGLADSEAEHTALIAALDAVEGRRVLRDEIEVLQTIAPYTLSATREQSSTVLAGHVPHDDLRDGLSALGVEAVAGLTLASGAPDGWIGAAEAGIKGLAPLESGQMMLQDKTLKMSGMARGPDEREAALAALASLPDGFDTEANIDMRDDGTPPAFELAFDASEGAHLYGKLPKGMSRDTVAQVLGLDATSGPVQGALFDHGQWALANKALAGLAGWLGQIEQATLRFENGTSALTVTPTPGSDQELITVALTEAMDTTDVTVIEAQDLTEDGTVRRNAITGQSEQFTDGYWLPMLNFTPDATTCARQSEAALEAAKITFVTGSARLGPRAVRAINWVAAVTRRCVNEAGLTAELGGHTDNTGAKEANEALSLERAQAVKVALEARGVPSAALTAVGYGQSEPIADNSTDDGRAANRRTTIQWSAGE
jgi:OOP family OmpA-OmpF porin